MYQKIEETFWTDPKVSNLPPNEKLLFIYLITNSHVHYSGLYQISRATILDETNLTPDALNKSLTSLIDNRLIRYDNDKKIVWVINMAKHQVQQGNKKNLIIGFAKQFNKLHKSMLIKEFLIYYATLVEGLLIPSEWDTDTMPESVALISSIKHKAVKKICAKAENATSSLLDSFNVFYTAYPKHKAKEPALKAWKKLNPNDSLLQTILQAIANAKETDSWKEDNGMYIPLPATWLNGKRWEDELNIPKTEQHTKKASDSLPVGVLKFCDYMETIMDVDGNCTQLGKENIVSAWNNNLKYPFHKEHPQTTEEWEKFITELKPS